MEPLIVDSVTTLDARAQGRVVVAASHGGVYSATLALAAGVGAAVLHDASFGRDDAGVAGLELLRQAGVAAAVVGHLSARIGDGADCYANGVITAVNAIAIEFGVAIGMRACDAALLLGAHVRRPSHRIATEFGEARTLWNGAPTAAPIWLLDSNSLVASSGTGAIVVTGSHGGLLGGDPASAIKARVFAAFYNDAGIGKDAAGISRLPALEAQGIAGVTVTAASARIGDARSTFEDGIVSRFNATARRLGAAPGIRAATLALRFARAVQNLKG